VADEAVVTAEGLALGYDGHPVLTGVDWTVRAGERWFLIGPNGGGKTTLLRAVLGLLSPRAGRIVLHPELACRERIGFVPQRCEFNHSLPITVREFVLLGTVGLGLRRAEAAAHLGWALAQASLDALARRSFWALSGGQRQRALVARALVRRPTLLVLDEPTNHLDPAQERALLELVVGLNAEDGVTMLFVTHDMALAARWATHVALVFEGRVVAGTAAEIFDRADLRTVLGVDVRVTREAAGAATVRIGDGG
jgi:ABC-type Mn2+/Zn2+ transport system ATPase subunit